MGETLKNKKILIVSPTPIFPLNAGNRSRIKSIVDLLRSHSNVITFLYAGYEYVDKTKMETYFEDRYFELFPKFELNRHLRIISKVKNLFSLVSNWSINWTKKDIQEHFKYNRRIDFYYPTNLDSFITDNFSSGAFDVVISEYVVFSKVFYIFPKALKIIDTHDVLSNRFLIYLRNGLKPEWYSLWRTQERMGLNRADIIWSIQEKEASFFSSFSHKRILTVPHVFVPVKNPLKVELTSNNTILYLGSKNSLNVDALNNFIVNVLSKIDIQNLDYLILIGGNIHERKNDIIEHPKIRYEGEIDHLSSFYDKGNICINPIKNGSGLKIKSIEALVFGKCLITYSCGIDGLEYPSERNEYCLLSESDMEFAKNTIEAICNPALTGRLGINASRFMYNYINSIELA